MNLIKRPGNPILIVDDEIEVLKSTELMLKSVGLNNVLTQSDPRKVMSILETEAADLIILDLFMPQMSGEELLTTLRTRYPEIPVVVLTSANDVKTAVRCMRLGASDYIVKPFEKEKLVCVVSLLNTIKQYQRENDELRGQLFADRPQRPDAFGEIITTNKIMISICNYLNLSAVSNQTILICGETGTGKELFAKAIHGASGRTGPFVAVNLAGVDDVVFSDTLFGHRKGAFTGADTVRPGLIKNAQGGTLFLDEIGDLNMQSQIKLLRLLQEHEFYPLGSDVAHRSETCIVLATNLSLPMAVKEGRFRRDLYFRISAHQVTIPPLRDRIEDIPLLVRHFVEASAGRQGKTIPLVPPELLVLLQNYSFPGNIRELESMVSEAVSQSSSTSLETKWFIKKIEETRAMISGLRELAVVPAASNDIASNESREPSDIFSAVDHPFPTLKLAEEWLIGKAMQRANNNQSVAAALLGISRQTLNGKLKKRTFLE